MAYKCLETDACAGVPSLHSCVFAPADQQCAISCKRQGSHIVNMGLPRDVWSRALRLPEADLSRCRPGCQERTVRRYVQAKNATKGIVKHRRREISKREIHSRELFSRYIGLFDMEGG